MKRNNSNWIGHFLLRDRILKHNIGRRIEGRGKQGIRRKGHKEMSGYWNRKRKQ